MDGHNRHPNASPGASTLPGKALHRNAHTGEARAYEPPHASRDAWRHPVSLAAMISAVASLTTALALFVK
jgi:hypothetical protein